MWRFAVALVVTIFVGAFFLDQAADIQSFMKGVLKYVVLPVFAGSLFLLAVLAVDTILRPFGVVLIKSRVVGK